MEKTNKQAKSAHLSEEQIELLADIRNFLNCIEENYHPDSSAEIVARNACNLMRSLGATRASFQSVLDVAQSGKDGAP